MGAGWGRLKEAFVSSAIHSPASLGISTISGFPLPLQTHHLRPSSEQELDDDTRKLPKENRLAPCNTRASPRWPQTHPAPICRVGMVNLPAARHSHPSAVHYNATLCARPRSRTPALPIFLIMHSGQQGNPPAVASSQPQTVPKRLPGSPWIAVEDCQHPRAGHTVLPWTPSQFQVALARNHTGMPGATVTELWLPLPLEGLQRCSRLLCIPASPPSLASHRELL